MCMNCGCGELDKRHQPTDITREDLERAAKGSGISLEKAATNLSASLKKVDETSRPAVTAARSS